MGRTDDKWVVDEFDSNFLRPVNSFSIALSQNSYFNFGNDTGSSGYGFRDNSGVIEYKDNGGAWKSFEIKLEMGNVPSGVTDTDRILYLADDSSVSVHPGLRYGIDSPSSPRFQVGALDIGNGTYFLLEDIGQNIYLQSTNVAYIGDVEGMSNGTFLSVNDADQIIDLFGNVRIKNAYILPGVDGAAGEVLTTDGTGALYWGAGGGGGVSDGDKGDIIVSGTGTVWNLDNTISPTFAGLTLSGLTATRIPIVGTSGLITNSANFRYDTTNTLYLGSTGRTEIWDTDTPNPYNLFIGFGAGNRAGITSLANTNIGIGSSALSSITDGQFNVAIGPSAGLGLTIGTRNFLLGRQTGRLITSGSGNVAIGDTALFDNVTGSNNMAIGRSAGENYTGSDLVAIGYLAGFTTVTGVGVFIGTQAGYLTTAVNSVMIGNLAGGNNVTGAFTTAVGHGAGQRAGTLSNCTLIGGQAGYNVTTSMTRGTHVGVLAGYNMAGNDNTSVGVNAMVGATGSTGASNTAMGYEAVRFLSTGAGNSGFGWRAGYANITGNYNTSMGYEAGYTNTAGIENVALGYRSLFLATSNYNVGLGSRAGDTISTGTRNTMLGALTDVTSGSINDSIAIGAYAVSTASNQLVVGSATSPVNLFYINEGVNSASPSSIAISGTEGSGTNIAGSTVTLRAGAGTGNATRAEVIIQSSIPTASGSTLQTYQTVAETKSGYWLQRTPNAAITDGDLSASEATMYLDEGANNLIVKVKYSDGVTVKTTTIALV